MDFTAHAAGVLREPDAVKWIDADHFVVANEGDYEGRSRSFTIFKRDGSVVFESGSSLERAIAAMGHFPDHRNKKGAELEPVEVATFDGVPHLFVASERASLVAYMRIRPICMKVSPVSCGSSWLSRTEHRSANTVGRDCGGQTLFSLSNCHGIELAWSCLRGNVDSTVRLGAD